MDKIGGAKLYKGRNRALTMILVLALIITAVIPNGVFGAQGDPAVTQENSDPAATPVTEETEGDDEGSGQVPDNLGDLIGGIFGNTPTSQTTDAPQKWDEDAPQNEGAVPELPPVEWDGVTAMGEEVVTDWAGLVAAMNNAGTEKITFGGPITRASTSNALASDLPRITRNLEINGNGFTLTLTPSGNGAINRPAFKLGSGTSATFNLHDVNIIGGGATTYSLISVCNTTGTLTTTSYYTHDTNSTAFGTASANWKINVSNLGSGSGAPTSGLIAAQNATVTLGGTVVWQPTASYFNINARKVTFAKNSRVWLNSGTTTVRALVGASNTQSLNNEVSVEEGAQVELYSAGDQALYIGTKNDATDTTPNTSYSKSYLTVSGKGTSLYCYGDGAGTGNIGATLSVCGGTGGITVDGGAVLTVNSRRTGAAQPAMISNMPAATFKVDGVGSQLNLTSNGSSNTIGATLRFRYAGNQTFDISNQGEVNITAKAYNSASSLHAAIRFGLGAGNDFICRTGGVARITNEGNGTANNGTADGANCAIVYDANNFGFDIQDEKSTVELISNFGPAVYAGDHTGGIIQIGKGGVFAARGRTAAATSGIFRAGNNFTFNANEPLFYDFSNTRPGGGLLIQDSSANSASPYGFYSTNSDVAAWLNGADVMNPAVNPNYSLTAATYRLSGTNFNTLVSNPDPEVVTAFGSGGMTRFSRISGNNAAPVFDKIIAPTNADKTIRIQGTVAEGIFLTPRPIWSGAFWGVYKITPYDGSAPYELKAQTENPQNVYGTLLNGVLYAANRNGRFLNTGDKVELIDAWKGKEDKTKFHQALGLPISATVSDKTPATPAKITAPATATVVGNPTIYANQKHLEGTWSLTEDAPRNRDLAQKIVLYDVPPAAGGGFDLSGATLIKNGAATVLGTLNADGTWSYDIPASYTLQAGHRIYVVLLDAADPANENPLQTIVYHDDTQVTAPYALVEAVRYEITSENVDIGTKAAMTLNPSDGSTFVKINNVKGIDLSKPIGSQDTAVSLKSHDWDTVWQSWAGQPPVINKTYNPVYQIAADNSFTQAATITVWNAEYVTGGPFYVIGANDIQKINTGQATKPLTDAELISLAKAWAAKKGTSPIEAGTVEVASRNYPQDGTTGTGTVTFRVKEEPATTITVKVTVSNGVPPTLTVTTPIDVPLGGTFNYAQGVSAYDNNLAVDITDKVTSSGAVNVNAVGVYHVTYSVEDSDGNKVSRVRTVFVGMSGDRYRFEATNFNIHNDDVIATPADMKELQILTKATVKVYDLNGNITTGAIAYVNNDGGYRKLTSAEIAAGELLKIFPVVIGLKAAAGGAVLNGEGTKAIDANVYIGDDADPEGWILTHKPFSISVADANAKTNAKIITWAGAVAYNTNTKTYGTVVVDEEKIEAKAGVYDVTFGIQGYAGLKGHEKATVAVAGELTLDVPTPSNVPFGTAFNPMQNVSAYDSVDKDLTSSIQITANTVNTAVPGVYTVDYKVTNSNLVTKTATRVVVINDGSFSVGKKYIVRAKSFIIRTVDADGSSAAASEAQIFDKAGIKAWSGQTGVETSAVILNRGNYYNGTVTYAAIKVGVGADDTPLPEDRAIRDIHARIVDKTVLEQTTTYVSNGLFGYAVGANNFRIGTVDETGVTNPTLLSRAAAQGWQLNDDLTPVSAAFYDYTGTRVGTPGLYTLTVNPSGVTTTRATVNVNVSNLTPPLLTVSTPIEISVGGIFNYMDGVDAVSNVPGEGNITSKVTYSGTVDVNTVGIYPITYTVKDAEQNESSAVRVVIVNDGSITIGNRYILQARNFVALKKDVTGSDNEILTKSRARAWNRATGAIVTDQIVVVSKGGYTDTVNETGYPIQLAVRYVLSGTTYNEPVRNIRGVVVDGEFIVEDDYYSLVANNVDITVTTVQDLSLAKLIEWANARAWNKNTLATTAVQVGSHNVLKQEGSYKADYEVAAKPAVHQERDVKVTKTAPPVITVNPTPHVVAKGSGAYDYMYNVTAKDYEGTDITASVTTSGAVDTNQDGVYVVTYSVTDKESISSTATRVVVVNDGNYIVTPTYILRARSFVIKGNDVAPYGAQRTAQILEKSKAKAWSSVTGASADAAVLNEGGYSPTENVYDISIVAKDNYGAVRNIKAMVVYDSIVVEAGDYFIVGNDILMNSVEDKAQTLAGLITAGRVRAYRINDALDLKPVKTDSYDGKFDGVQGNYKATFSVVEAPSAKLEDLPVKVDNGKKPQLNVTTPITVPLHGTFDPAAGVDAWDDEDKDLTAKITSSGTVDVNTKGIYYVTYSVTDSDYNTETKVRTVAVGYIRIGPYLVSADSFAIKSDNVVTTPVVAKNAQIIDASKATFTDLEGKPTAGALSVPSDGGYRQLNKDADGNFTEDAATFPVRISVAGYEAQGYVPINALVLPDFDHGDEYILAAHNFKILVSEAKTNSDAKVIQWAGAKSYDIETMLPAGTVKVDKNDVKAAKGVYDVTFSVVEEPTALTKTVEGTVYSKDPPVITATSPIEIQLNGTFNPMQAVTAHDGDDPPKDITSDVKIDSNNVNVAVAGVYVVKYSVKNFNDDTATATRVVVVNDGTFNVGRNYIVRAKSFVIRKVDAALTNSDDQIRAKAGVKAWSATTGDEVTATILSDDGYYDGVKTDFAIKVGVGMDAGTMPVTDRAIRDIKAKVVSKDVLVEKDGYYIGANNVRINTTEETGIANSALLTRSDTQAWRITDTLPLVEAEVSLYSGLRNGTPGLYDLGVRVKDYPAAEAAVKVNVSNYPLPILTVSTPVKISVGGTFSYMDGVSATSNVPGDGGPLGDITSRVTYAGIVNTNVAGVYPVLYSVTDGDHQTVTATRVVIVGNGVPGDKYIVDASNFVALRKDVKGSDNEILANSGARIWYVDTGLPAPASALEVRDSGGYTDVVKDYPIKIGGVGDAKAVRDITGKVVDGDYILDDGTYIIVASDVSVTLSTSIAQYTPTQLIIWAKAAAWLKEDLSSTPIELGTRDINKDYVGQYHSDYQVVAKPAVKVNGRYDVTGGQKPVLNVTPNPDEVARDSGAYDYMRGVTATDNEDDLNSIPLVVTTSGAVDTAVDGVYVVKYNVADSDGNKADEVTRVVVVNDGNYVVTPNYILRAHSFVIKGADVAASSALRQTQILNRSRAAAWNSKTAAPVDFSVLNDGNYGPTKGVYPITIVVKDDNNVKRNIRGEVVDDTIIIEVGDYYIIGNPIKMTTTVDKTSPNLIVLGDVRAKKKDDALTPGTVALKDYTGKFDGQKGNYKATFNVVQQPTSEAIIDVVVDDGVKPTLNVSTPIVIDVGGTFNYAEGVSARDENLGTDITSKIVSSGAVDVNTAGGYKVTYSVKDSNGNEATKDRIVVVGGVAGDKYILFTDSFAITSSAVIETPTAAKNQQILEMSNTRAFHKEDFSPAPEAQLRVRNDGGYRQLTNTETAKVFDVNIDIADDVKATKDIKALVAKGFKVGPNYILTFGHPTITVAEAKTNSNAKALEWTGAQAFHKWDMTPAEVNVDSNGIQPTVGKYDVVLSVRLEPATVDTAVVTVRNSGMGPIITASTPSNVPIGGPFNPMQNVTAKDSENTDLTAQIQITANTVDINKAGVYTVDYYVKDKDDMEATARRVVVVNDGTFSVGKNYIVRARSFIVRKVDADSVNSEDQIREKATVKAWDGATGEEVTAVILNSGGYYAGTGTDFAIKVGVAKDSTTLPESDRAIRDIKAKVVDKQVLVEKDGYIIGANNVRLNVVEENGITDAQFLNRSDTEAWRVYNGLNADDSLTKVDAEVFQYTGFRNGTPSTPGNYNLTVNVKGHVDTRATVDVLVTKGLDPILTVETPIHIPVGGSFDYRGTISAVNRSEPDPVKADITDRITYAGIVDTNVKGVYTVDYSVTDDDYNTVTATRVVVVGPLKIGDKYIVDAENFVTLLKDVSGGDAEILGNAVARAWDKFTGDPANDKLRVPDNGGYKKAVGDYDIVIGGEGDPKSNIDIKGKVVDGDDIFIDEEYVIVSSNVKVTINIAQTQYTAEKLLEWAKVAAWKKSDLSAVDAQLGANNVDKDQVGSYTATYEVKSHPATKVTGKVEITKGEVPELTVTPNPHEVRINSGAYDYDFGVSATDKEDDSLSIPLVISHTGSVDTTKRGVYPVIYSVTDSDSNTVTQLRTVVVNDGTIIITPTYILQAEDFVIKGADVAATASARTTQILDRTFAAAWNTTTAQPVDAIVMNAGGYGPTQNDYDISIAVDLDRNVTKTVRARVLDDVIVIPGTLYYIVGNPIRMNPTVDKTSPDLIVLGDVRAYERGVGLTPAAVSLESYTGLFDGTQGNYTAVFHVNANPADKITIPVLVTEGNKPELKVDTPVMVPLHGTFNPATGVSAWDDEDKDLTAKIISSGAVDVNTKGVYPVIYSVTDSDYNTVTSKRLVWVGDYVAGDKYIIDAQDFAILSKDVVESPLIAKNGQILTGGKAAAWDKFTGDPVNVTFRVLSDGGYSKAESLYNIRIDIQDDPKAMKEILARVIDGDVLIDGPDYILALSNFTISVNEAKAMTDDKVISWAKARAFDKNNKYAPASKVTVDNNGILPNKGAYDVVFSVTENSSITGTAVGTVAGGNAPVLTVPTPSELPIGGSYNPMNGVSAWDDENGNLTARVTVASTVDVNKAGVYIDVYSVSDDDDNKAIAKRVVVVNDGTYSVGAKYIVKAKSFVIKRSEASTTDSEAQIFERAGVKAWNVASGDTVMPTILANSGYYNGVGSEFSIRIGVSTDQATVPEAAKAIRNITARVVDKDVVVEGANYIIAANNIKMTPSEETGITNDQLISRAGAVAYRSNDILESATVAVANYGGSRAGVKGIYNLSFLTPSEASLTATVKAVVTSGAAPVITAPSPVEVAKGTAFNYMADVTAVDAEEGTITSRVTYSTSVDVNRAGVYTVAYSVVDSDFNEATMTRVVVVNDGTIVIGTNYIVQASHFAILKKDVSGTDAEILSKAGATAWRKSNGVQTLDVAVVASNGGYKNTAGDYNIRIGVAGDATAARNIIGKVIESNDPDQPPIVVTEEYIISASHVSITLADALAELSNAKLIEWSGAKAWKKSDMSEVSVNVSASNAVAAVGTYDVTYAVTANAATSIATQVQVTDGKPPVLYINPNPHKVSLGSGLYPYTLGVTAVDGNSLDLTSQVTFAGTVDTNKAGVYKVVYSVSDSKGNIVKKTRVVVVDDGNFIVTPTYILKAESFVVKGTDVPASASDRLAQILSKTTAQAWRSDTGNEVSAVVTNADGYNAKAGTYNVTIAVNDNRTVTRTVKALVVNDSVVIKDGNYYIVGNPIKMTTVVDKTHPSLVTLGDVRAYQNDAAMTLSPVTMTAYNGKFDGKIGTYYADFSVNAEPARKLEKLEVVVLDSQKPILNVTTPIVLPLGGPWDPLVGVSATDAEDDLAGIPLIIKSTGTVNTSVDGLYKVTYSVTDSDYNTVTKTRLVAVGDYVVGDGYLLKAGSFGANVMGIAGTADEIIRLSGAKAYDSEGRPLTAVVKNAGGYTKAGGSYQILVGISGKDGVPTKTILGSISADRFTVTFDGNGATSWAVPMYITVTQPSSTVGVLPSTPSREGYTFNGWTTGRDGTGSRFNGDTPVGANLTVYASWLINSYTLSFNVNGGNTTAPSAQTVQYNALAQSVTTPRHANSNGHPIEFRGWNTQRDGSGVGWSFGLSRMPANNVTLYAQWGEKSIVETVTVEKPTVVTVEKPTVVRVPGATRTVNNNTVTPGQTVYIPTQQAIIAPPTVVEPTTPPAVEIDPVEPPTTNLDHWALLNLLLVLIGFAMVVFGLAAMILRRRRPDELVETDKWSRVKNVIGAIVAIVAAIANVVIYSVTQKGFDTPMKLADTNTIIIAVVFLLLVVGLIAALRRVEYTASEEDERF